MKLFQFAVDEGEQCRLQRLVEMKPASHAKFQWFFKWFEDGLYSFPQKLIALAIVEGIFPCSSFAAIYWIRQRGALPGLCFSNDLIARDEQSNVQFACLLHVELQEKVTSECAHAMVGEAVDLEKAFFSGMFTHRLCDT